MILDAALSEKNEENAWLSLLKKLDTLMYSVDLLTLMEFASFQLSSPIQVASKTFQRSSQQRHLSLQDRKKLLIDAARQRYLEKHCGNI